MALPKKRASLIYDRCSNCRPCPAMAACPAGAIKEEEGRLYVHIICSGCGSCTRACPEKALTIN